MKNLFSKLTGQELLLFEAIKNCSIESIEISLNKGANINVFGEQYEVYTSISPLEYSIYCNADKNVITCLIDHEAKIDEKDNAGNTALLCAAMNGKVEVMQFLLAHGASLQEKNEQGKTAFDFNAS